MNNLKITLMMIVLMAIFMAIGFMFGGQNGMILAFVFACVMNFGSYWFSHKIVLKIYKAQPVSQIDHPRLHRVVARVASQAMIPMPKTYIVNSKAPNAFATGRNIENAAVAVTIGLLDILSEDELEGVIGHEIAHILNKDMLIGTIAATFAGAIGIFASIARWGAIFGGFSRGSNRDDGIVGLLAAAIVAPLMAMILQMAISRQREYKADKIGSEITGKPLSLASALEKLHRAPSRRALAKYRATANLMIASPLSAKGIAGWFSTHPPVKKRIEKLNKQAIEAPYQSYAR